MKTDVTTEASERRPAPVDLDARYKGIGISAVAAAIRYNSGAAETERAAEPRPRSAA